MNTTRTRWSLSAAVLSVLILGVVFANAQDLMKTGFEATGDPDQVYTAGESIKTKTNWRFLDPAGDPNLAVITTSEHQAGAQALQLNQGAAVDRDIVTLLPIDGEVVWIQAYFKGPGSSAQTPSYPASPTASSIIHFSAANGIQMLNGDGAGAGAWVTSPSHGAISADQWYQVTLRQDYGMKKWDCFINGTKENATALGFRDTAVAKLNGFMNLSDTTSYLDSVWVRLALRGDANGDLALDTADVVRTIQIANTPTPALELIWGGNADVAGIQGQIPDGMVNDHDVAELVRLIVKRTSGG